MKATSPVARAHFRDAIAARRERGIALVTTIVLLAVILALLAGGLLVARADLVMFRNFRDGARLYYKTRAALVRSVAELSAGYSFDPLLDGPDGRPGTSDDGSAPAAGAISGCRVGVLEDRTDPDSRLAVDGNWRVRFLASCDGPSSGSRRIEGIVGRDDLPFVPAALYLERPYMRVTAPVLLDGRDHQVRDRPGSPTGSLPPVPPASSPMLEVPIALSQRVRDGGGAAVLLRGSTALDAPAFATRLRLALPPPLGVLPTAAFSDMVVHIEHGAAVTGPSVGSGVLAVDGDLEIAGPLDFAGLLVVNGALRVLPTGSLVVRGLLWIRGAGTGPALEANGPLTVIYSSNAATAADRILTLPRRAVLLAERELL